MFPLLQHLAQKGWQRQQTKRTDDVAVAVDDAVESAAVDVVAVAAAADTKHAHEWAAVHAADAVDVADPGAVVVAYEDA